MSLLLRLVHIAFVRLNIQIFHFHHNQLSLLLPKHRKIWLIATTHRVNRLGLHLYYKTNSSFQLQRMMSTQQKWVPSVFYHIGTIVKKWKFPVIFPIVENAKNRIQIVVKYPTCRTCDWRSGTTNSLFCSFPWWICYKSLGGSFAPKCSWCLECVNFRCHVQICSYTILTAKITQLIKLLSLGYTASRYTTQHFLRICSNNQWREWLLHHCSRSWSKPHLLLSPTLSH